MASIKKNDDLLVLFKKIAGNFKSSAAELASAIASLGGRIANLDGRTLTAERNVSDDIKMVWSGRFACIVTCQGGLGVSYASYIVQGYGVSSVRLQVTPLQKGANATYNISSTEQAVFFNDLLSGTTYSVFMLQGKLPTIS